MKQFSVVIPCYNLGQFLSIAIKSVLKQTLSDVEIIVVDDASTEEDTLKVIKRLVDSYPQVRFLQLKKNGGVSSARNRGIELAQSSYILCLDADDTIDATYLEKAKRIFDADKTVGIVSCYLQSFGEHSVQWESQDKVTIEQALKQTPVHTASCFRKILHDKGGGYDEKLLGYEDWDHWLRIMTQGCAVRVIPEYLFNYNERIGSKVKTSNKNSKELVTGIVNNHQDLYKKHVANVIAHKHYRWVESCKNYNDLKTELDLYREVYIPQKDQQIKQKDQQIQKKDQQIQKKECEIEFMRSSKFWKVRYVYIHYISSIKQGIKQPSLFIIFFQKRVKKIRRYFLPNSLYLNSVTRRSANDQKGDLKFDRCENVVLQKFQDPLVSIIVPYYNYGKYIKGALDSIVNQTFSNLEIIIINDGSNDKYSNDMLREIEKDSKYDVHILHQDNQGLAQTRNHGAEISKGKYICFFDPDDTMEPTYIEKMVLCLEQNQNLGSCHSWLRLFGSQSGVWETENLDPILMRSGNISPSHSVIRKLVWEKVKAKNNVGFLSEYNGYFEDWVFWIDMACLGYGGKSVPETLINYRIHDKSLSSLHKDTKDEKIQELIKHRQKFFKDDMFCAEIKHQMNKNILTNNYLTNLDKSSSYDSSDVDKLNSLPRILIILPWLSCGGASRVVVNFCTQLMNEFHFSFITGLKSENEWEDKFKEISDSIYHLQNIFNTENQYFEFICNYIRTRNVRIIHIVHNSCIFGMLSDLKKEFPELRIVNTVFNVVAEHFEKGVIQEKNIDAFTTDNSSVARALRGRLIASSAVMIEVIHNGIDIKTDFNPALFDQVMERKNLRLSNDDLAVFYIGRLSDEKCPDKFVEAALHVVQKIQNVTFFIIGDGPMKKTLIYKIIDSGYQNKIQYLGYQSDIARFLTVADVFVLPSKTEGFPLSNIEAMAMNTVVVASDVGGVSDAIHDKKNGFLIEPCSSEAIVNKIAYISENRDIINKITQQGRIDVEEQFTIKIMSNKYRSVYKKLL